MNIGIITYYRVANFGANLQAVSTYYYLLNNGHNPLFIQYESDKSHEAFCQIHPNEIQKQEHIKFIDSTINNQSIRCKNAEEINNIINKYNLDGIIIGSDAVLQHHPFRTRIKRGKRKPFYIIPMIPERLFPNCFWGCGIQEQTPIAMMSVSSQNSAYKYFRKKQRQNMEIQLKRMTYLSVRDTWTQNMVASISKNKIIPPITPDPVFAFNENAGFLISTKEELINKYKLPKKYVLISLLHQDLTMEQMKELKEEFSKLNMYCVAFPMPVGIRFKHPFDYSIDIPLPILDWYGLIKYASAYIGSNMHPIIVSLHNGTPFFSLDYWGTTDFWGNHKNDGSSKVEHILKVFGLEQYRSAINKGKCNINIKDVVHYITNFPKEQVLKKSEILLQDYKNMMEQILNSFQTKLK